ncbi:MAG: cytochrome oxidase I, partial [Actinomycetota bacterium]|nr:cytochrome oxidase I [Actinomycetota bacterium]
DIGARTPAEIALAILARIVEVRRGDRAPAPGAAPPATAPAAAVDPICGMTVAALPDTPQVEHDGRTVYFCCEGCQTTFEQEHVHAGVHR